MPRRPNILRFLSDQINAGHIYMTHSGDMCGVDKFDKNCEKKYRDGIKDGSISVNTTYADFKESYRETDFIDVIGLYKHITEKYDMKYKPYRREIYTPPDLEQPSKLRSEE